MATIGDLNQDGYPEFLIASSGYGGNAGRVYLLYGGNSIANNIDPDNLPLSQGVTLNTSTCLHTLNYCYLGSSVVGVGDINNDTIPDYAIGETGYNSIAGRVFLVYGKRNLKTMQFDTFAPARGVAINGAGSSWLGGSIGAADFNGDGVNDILMGAAQYATGLGRAYVLFGKKTMTSTINVDSMASSSIGFSVLYGTTCNSCNFGQSVGRIGDTNGDGREEIAIGSNYNNRGRVFVLYGSNRTTNLDLFTMTLRAGYWIGIVGTSCGSCGIGRSLTYIGDMNSDGNADILFGAPGYTNGGRVYLIWGGGAVNIDLALTLSPSQGIYFGFLTGTCSNCQIGSSISTADINGDGIRDIIIGASGYSSYNGRVYVVYGSLSWTGNFDLNTMTSATGIVIGYFTGICPSCYIGATVTGAGDLDNDGYEDILVAAPQARGLTGFVFIIYGAPDLQNVNLNETMTQWPTTAPTFIPTRQPTFSPSRTPTMKPSVTPSRTPSCVPTKTPTNTPTVVPSTAAPSITPTKAPTVSPSTASPSKIPTKMPTAIPTTARPTAIPTTSAPSAVPTYWPTSRPTTHPSSQPTTQPTNIPSSQPSTSPSNQPSTQPSSQPTTQPTSLPTSQPSSQPTLFPSSQPTTQPSAQPTSIPSSSPSGQPSSQPSNVPSSQPSMIPSAQPSMQPSSIPTSEPSAQPSSQPISKPSSQPSSQPSSIPSSQPSNQPTSIPSSQPSTQPSSLPSSQPTVQPSSQPISKPSSQPSSQPSGQPTIQPSCQPTCVPSSQPSTQPSFQPSSQPSAQPSSQPISRPSSQPSNQPSGQPTTQPSRKPSSQPSSRPTVQPSGQPSRQPSIQPTTQPSSQPTRHPTIFKIPSCIPTYAPSMLPTQPPTISPSCAPTRSPTIAPTVKTSFPPTAVFPSSIAIRPLTVDLNHINVRRELNIISDIQTATPCIAQWKMNESAAIYFNLTGYLTTPITRTISGNSGTTLYFNLQANTLYVDKKYTVGIACGNLQSMVTIITNQPPKSGSYGVTPTTGTEMHTEFRLRAQSWQDPDLPLTYQFAYLNTITGGIATLSPVQNSSVTTVYLPAGNQLNRNILSTLVIVYDSYGADAQLQTGVEVKPVEDLSLLLSVVTERLNATISSQNVDQLMQTIVAASTAVGRVNCSSTPNCVAINRYNCSTVAHTCGNCLPSYLGEQGNKNTPCMSTTQLKVKSTENTCKTSRDCSNLQYCDVASSKCLDNPKACPNHCSGHGSCVFILVESQKRTPTCSVLSTNCDAQCVCDDGYGGDACELTPQELASKQQLTTTLLSNLLKVSQVQAVNASSTTVLNNIGALQTLTQSTTNLNIESADLIQQLVSQTFAAALTMKSVSYVDLQGALGAIDTALKIRNTMTIQNNTLFSSNNEQRNKLLLFPFVTTSGILDLFCDLINRDTVPGQRQSNFIYYNFRISSQQMYQKDAEQSVAAVPLNPLESFQQDSASFMHVQNSSCSDQTCKNGNVATLQIIEMKSALLPDQEATTSNHTHVTSNVIHVRLLGISKTIIGIRNIVKDEDLNKHSTLQNFTTNCGGKLDRQEVNFTCPDSQFVITHRCRGKRESMVSYCPPLSHACNLVNVTSGFFVSNVTQCTLANYTQAYTYCSCTIAFDNPNGRRLQASGSNNVDQVLQSSGVLALSSMALYQAQDVKTTFAAASQLTSPEAIEKSLIVILMFCILWVGGMLLVLLCTADKIYENHMNPQNKKIKAKQENIKDGLGEADLQQIYSKVVTYIESSFPFAFQELSMSQRLVKELWSHHAYVSFVISLRSEGLTWELFVEGFHILTTQTILMFLLAFFYDLQAPPDDGTCVNYLSEQTCLARKSFLDYSQSYCAWEITNNDDIYGASNAFCQFADAPVTLKASLYVAIIASCASALINRPISYLFDILTSTTATVPAATNQVAPQQDQFQSILPVSSNTRSNLNNRRTANVTDVSQARVSYQQKQRMDEKRGGITSLVVAAVEVTESDMREIPEEVIDIYQDMTAETQFIKKVFSSKQSQEKHPGIVLGPNNGFGRQSTGVDAVNPVTLEYSMSPFTVFQNSLLAQFQLLLPYPEERREYQKLWGTADSETISNLKMWTLFAKEIQYVQDDSYRKIQKLKKLKSASQDTLVSDVQIGHELLHIFVSDLLGRTTPAAIIYNAKMNEEFRHTRVVTYTLKVIVVCILLGLNAFFAYYSVLKGYVQGVGWQYNYLFACIMQLFSEILFFETMENFWMHFLIPSFATKEVQSAFHRILKTIHTLCNAKHVQNFENEKEEEKFIFNTAEHWYVSYQIARSFPNLMESMMILSYSTPYPGELAYKWKPIYQLTFREMITRWFTQVFYASSENQPDDAQVSFGVFLFMFIQWFVAFPYELQRMLVRFFMPFVFSSLVMLWEMIENPIIAYSVLAFIVVGLFGGLVGFYIYSLAETPSSTVAPQPIAIQNDKDVHAEVNGSQVNDTEEGGELHKAPRKSKMEVVPFRLPNEASPEVHPRHTRKHIHVNNNFDPKHKDEKKEDGNAEENVNLADFDDNESLYTLSNDDLTIGSDDQPIAALQPGHFYAQHSSSSTTISSM